LCDEELEQLGVCVVGLLLERGQPGGVERGRRRGGGGGRGGKGEVKLEEDGELHGRGCVGLVEGMGGKREESVRR